MTRTPGSVVACVLAIALHAAAGAAEDARWRLLLFEDENCAYCVRWDAEVGAVYPRTREGRLARLVRVPLAQGVPDDVRVERAVRFTPTFVLLDPRGRERGRITGYLDEEQFWGLLGVLLEREGLH